jgi:hypothetical protein
MTGVTLNATDAAELAEMLQFLAEWLQRDPGGLSASLEASSATPPTTPASCARTCTGSPSCSAAATANPSSARRGDTPPASPRPAEDTPVPAGLNVVRPRASALRALHVDPRRGTDVHWHLSGAGQIRPVASADGHALPLSLPEGNLGTCSPLASKPQSRTPSHWPDTTARS